jgi:hypothetical protein
MIDLSQALPNTITVDGKAYLVKTDFREWLKFSKVIENKKAVLADTLFLFKEEYPNKNFLKELVDFFANPNNVPNYTDSDSTEILLDYLEDSEYIYASFMAVYGIDLCEVELHWWKFKALLLGLPDDSKIKQIMSMRGYNPKDAREKPEEVAKENKRAWSLPDKHKKEKIEEIKNFFG